jgi:uncharacterized membrane protein
MTMTDQSTRKSRILADTLGVTSFALGLAELFAPAKVAALVGIEDRGKTRSVIRALGARECGHGAAVLFGNTKMVWTRVAGDALDIALLGKALADQPGRDSRRRGTAATVALAGIASLDLLAGVMSIRDGGGLTRNAEKRELRATVTVWRLVDDVYGYWRDFTNLPTFMYHLQSVRVDDAGRSHWVANAPVGNSVEWDAEMTADEPNRRIAWRSLPGSTIENRGSVEFTPTPDKRGTEVRVVITYNMPAGALGKAISTVLGESPEQQVNDDLRRFKQMLEAGEVLRSNGSPAGTVAARQMHQHSAQPKQAS